jgi:3-phosphoshikimate 1-carboxyvinyltransferase
MGARIDGGDRLPIAVTGGDLGGISYLNGHGSAQVKSAVLLAGLGGDAPVAVIEPLPSRDHSERMLAAFGVEVRSEQTDQGLQVSLPAHRRLHPASIDVAGDPSSAAFPLVAALTTPGSRVTVTNVLANRLRTGLFATLQQMGADLEFTNLRWTGGEEVADIVARDCSLRGVTVPAERAPSMIDEYPILAVAAACAGGETIMHGLGELRFKESDRLAAMVDGLTACGIDAWVEGDSLHVRGGSVRGGALIPSHGDHRIAMSFLILGLVSDAPVGVDEAQMIGTSFPGFVPLMRSLGAAIEAA